MHRHQIAIAVLGVLLAAMARNAASDEVRFDFGTESSAVAEGYTAVTGQTAYSSDLGYGWKSAGQQGFDTTTPGHIGKYQYRGFISRPGIYEQFLNDMRRDGVESAKDMTFRVDLPNGAYRLKVIVGHMIDPLESLWLDCNGVNIAKDIPAAHRLNRNRGPGFGFFYNVRFNVDVTDGSIQLRFFGDDTQFRENMEFLKSHFPETKDNQGNIFFRHPKKVFQRKFDPDDPQVFDPGQPFQKNSLLGIEILPAVTPPFKWDGATLNVAAAQFDGAGKFAAAINSREFEKAEQIVDGASEKYPLDAASGYLSLLGHPETHAKVELGWIEKAKKVLERAPNNCVSEEYSEDLAFFEEARHRFINRSKFRAETGEGYDSQEKRSEALMARIQPDSPLYYKAQQYYGRSLGMRDPNRWGSPTGDCRRLFRRLMETWPRDKYGLFYTQNVWDQDEDWHFEDYLKGTEDAPEWARALKEVHGRVLDMTEWWRANKQEPDGQIGGGWGDDVEIVQFFGLYGFISEGASPETMALTENLIDGMWNYSELDPEAGFCRPVADAEHSAEWSGDTLGLMVQLKYGNPIWVERAMKTAKLMRSLWMAPNKNGDFHFKANFFGALRTGGGAQSNDSYINYRATRPAVMVHWYNEHPGIAELFTKWAGAWRAAAMSSERGKPHGVFPAEVGFPGGTLGGINSPNWYTSAHPKGTVNYDFAKQTYKEYLTGIMTMAYGITGDMKYLEPLRLEAELAQAAQRRPVKNPKPGSAEWAGKILSRGGGGRGGGGAVEVWKSIEKKIAGTSDEPKILVDKKTVANRSKDVADYMKERWPNMTTETSATDRVVFPGIASPYFFMAGISGSNIWQMAATYAGIGRDAVAFVQIADERNLKVLAYNFTDEPIKGAVIPWLLEVGGSYDVVAGVDEDGDDEPDVAVPTDLFALDRRGKRCWVNLAPKKTTIIRLKQTKAGHGGDLFPDLAIVPEEFGYISKWPEIEVVVHNIGSLSAEDIKLTASEILPSGEVKKIGDAHISYIAWPQDFEAATMRVGFGYTPKAKTARIRVEIDPEGKIDEITEVNNIAECEMTFDMTPRKKKPAAGRGGR